MNYIDIQNSECKIIVDDEDYERLVKFKWYVKREDGSLFRTTPRPRHRSISFANQVMQNFINVYDHISRDKFDNRKLNLRLCSHNQNMMNRAKWSGCTSRYKGVYWNKWMKMWHAQIRVNNKRKHLGFFETEEAAAKAYDSSAVENFQEFAVLNFKP